MNLRKIEEIFFKILMILSTFAVLAPLLLILFEVVRRGFSAVSIEMLTQPPKGGYYLGGAGGILNAILGSLYLGIGATVLAFFMSLPVVFFINLYIPKSRFSFFIKFSFDVLWGIPSIVYGAFGFVIMIFLGIRASLLAGIITVALFELPIMVRLMDDVVTAVPDELKEMAYALGSTRLETAFKVVFKQVLPGLITGVIMAFGRGIGDAASVLFTAGFTDSVPNSLFRPAATLPLAIFFQLQTPLPEVKVRAYASAFVLTIIVLFISVLSRTFTKLYSKHTIK